MVRELGVHRTRPHAESGAVEVPGLPDVGDFGQPSKRLSAAEEEQLKYLLTGNEEEIGEGLRRLDWYYRYKIGGGIRRLDPDISPQGLAEVWQNTLHSILRKVMRRTIKFDHALDGLVWAIARRHGSKLEWQLSREQKRPSPAPLDRGGERKHPPSWRLLTGLQQGEVFELLDSAILQLPAKQREIAEICCGAIAEGAGISSLAELSVMVADQMGTRVPHDSITLALQLWREKSAELLSQNGYDFLVGVEESTATGGVGWPETQPLDQLIVQAVRSTARTKTGELPDLVEAERCLSKHDRDALDALGLDLAIFTQAEYTAFRAWDSALCGRRQADEETYLRSETIFQGSADGEQTIESLSSCYENLVSEKRLAWAPDYRFSALIGEGGQGVVYLVKCPGTDGFNTLLALKVFTPGPYATPGHYVADMRRMARVASVVARIHHDNVLEVQTLQQQSGIRMMLMEWIDGYDLGRLMVPSMLERIRHGNSAKRCEDINRVVVTTGRTHPKLRPGMAVAIVRHCLDALDQMHAHGLVHGDIKLSNIMLRRNGHVKLIDIGSAFLWKESHQPYHCTYRYAAPEILEGAAYTPQSDLASLGYVLIELLSGCLLFVGLKPGRALLNAKRSLPERLGELLPEKVQKCRLLVELCRRLVHPDLSLRFGSARDAELDSECGALAFLEALVHGHLSTAYDHEIRLWLEALD